MGGVGECDTTTPPPPLPSPPPATGAPRAEDFASATPYTMGDAAWGVLMGFVLDGAQWASRGPNWCVGRSEGLEGGGGGGRACRGV
jgi:hypothetical protein